MKKIINKYGVFYINDFGQYDREDGPAVELTYGTKAWYKNGEYHREDGPAVEYANGNRIWLKNSKYHREAGPAIEYADGEKFYYYNDIWYPKIKTDEEWKRFIKLMVFQ